jgi:hypothetical protein
VLGAQVSDELGDLRLGESLSKGGHLDTAAGDLGGDLVGVELFADVGERWGAIGALEVIAVAEDAAFVAEEDGSGYFVLFGGGAGGKGEKGEW